jgi:anti-anti-sigma factor
MALRAHIRGTRAALVTVTGDVDTVGRARLEDLVRLAESGLELVIDLSGITSIDPSAIEVLIRTRDACVERGRSLTVNPPPSTVRHGLDIAAIDGGLTIENKPRRIDTSIAGPPPTQLSARGAEAVRSTTATGRPRRGRGWGGSGG